MKIKGSLSFWFLIGLHFVWLPVVADARPASLKSISLEGERIYLEVEGKDKIETKTFRLDAGDPTKQRLVIDFQGAHWKNIQKKGFEKAEELNIRTGQFSETPPVARLVIEGPREQVQKIELIGKEGEKFALRLPPSQPENPKSAASTEPKSGANPTEVKASSDRKAGKVPETPLTQAAFPAQTSMGYDGVLVEPGNPSKIMINAPEKQEIKYRTFLLDSPNRLVVDLLNWEAPVPARQPLILDPKTSLVMKIRTGRPEGTEKILRLVFDLSRSKLSYASSLSPDKRQMVISLSDKEPVISQSLEKAKKAKDSFRVMIDAGHGGYDAGAIYSGIEEKSLTLAIANELEKQLISKGYTVAQTRRTDLFVSLEDRVDMTNRFKPDIFISLHCNALQSEPSVSGVETYFYTPQSKMLAKYTHKRLVDSSKAEDRHIRESRFVVIRETPFPSILVEVGFLSNAEERKNMSDRAYQRKLADGLTHGISDYFDNIDNLELALQNEAKSDTK